MVPPATHRTILVVDVEKFGDQSRTDAQRVTIHGGLYDLLYDAFRASGIRWDSCHREDRGDGVMVLAPAGIPKVRFSDRLPGQLAAALSRYNKTQRRREARIRLRMALHAGEVTFDDTGAVSSAVNTAFRLLDAPPLKQALTKFSTGALALIASSRFYFDVIRNSPDFCPEAYSPIPADVKETSTIGWMAMVSPRGLVRRKPSEPWRVRLRESAGGLVHGPGIMVGGRYVITAAHVVASALRLPPDEHTAWPAEQVLFDVPARPQLGLQRAEIIFWQPTAVGGKRPGLGIAGLSIAGPAIHGTVEPVFRFDLGVGSRVVRLHACAAQNGTWDRTATWALLPSYDGNGQERIPLGRLTDESPVITSSYYGSDVVDEQSGDILGLVVADTPGDAREQTWLAPIGKIAEEWPLLRHTTGLATAGAPEQARPRAPRSADILPLIDKGLKVPALANAQSRHRIVSELPLEVMLTTPRSSTDRADLAALLWSCARVPGALNELARKIRETSLGSSNADDLANELERIHV
jgi:effector-associated domain 2 (EAD2)-containing protein